MQSKFTGKSLFAFFVLLILAAQSFSYVPQYADRTKLIPLRWRQGQILVSLSKSLVESSSIRLRNPIADVFESSIESWQQAIPIKLQIASTEKQSVSSLNGFGDGISLVTNAATAENLELFSGNFYDAPARTRVFFDRRGFITEADIVLNPYQVFSDGGEFGTFDLESTITHEIGHLLGLDHSELPGATMNANVGRNGFHGVPSFSGRSLSSDDIAGIRSLYSHLRFDERCCGSISGKISASGFGSDARIKVWAEDNETGAIVALVSADALGRFKISGLEDGDYRVLFQVEENKSGAVLSQFSEIGVTTVSNGTTDYLNGQIFADATDRHNFLFGFNGLLSKVVIPISAIGENWLLVGEANAHGNFDVESASDHIEVRKTSVRRLDYGDGLDVFALEISVANELPDGDYSIIICNDDGRRFALIGALTIENKSN